VNPIGVLLAFVGLLFALAAVFPSGTKHDETRVYECPGGLTFTGVWDWRHERLIDGDQFVIYPPQGCKITIIEGTK
jgi:hypothetical protein